MIRFIGSGNTTHPFGSTEEFEKVWDSALAERPGSLMAEIDPESRRKYTERVNRKLRESFNGRVEGNSN